MSFRSLPPFLLSILFLTACSSTPQDPIVATDSNLAPEPVGLDNRPAADLPEQLLLDPNRVLARVNDEIITVRAIQAAAPQDLTNLGNESEAVIRNFLDWRTREMIKERLFLQAAERLGVTLTKDEIDRAVKDKEKVAEKRGVTLDEDLEERGIPRWEWEADLKRALLGQKLQAMLLGTVPPTNQETRQRVDLWVSPKEIRDLYDRNVEHFRQPELAQVEAIFFRKTRYGDLSVAKAEAEKAVARIRGGEEIAAVMDELGEEPLEQFLEPFGRGRQPEFIESFVFGEDVKEGDVSDPIRVRQSGYLVLKLVKYQPERLMPFEEASRTIHANLSRAKGWAAIFQIQLAFLRDSVVTPLRHKEYIRRELRGYLAKQFDELAQ